MSLSIEVNADSGVNDGKCENGETKSSCWAGELGTAETTILPHHKITELPVP